MPATREEFPTTEVRLTHIACDNCDWEQDLPGFGQGHLFKFAGGYASDWPGDMSECEVVLCDECAKAFVEGLKRPPKVDERDWLGG